MSDRVKREAQEKEKERRDVKHEIYVEHAPGKLRKQDETLVDFVARKLAKRG